jgi:hypothetical protein
MFLMNTLSLREILLIAIFLGGLFHSMPSFAQGCPTPSFAPALTLPAGNDPFAVAVGDFNGDGKPDIAVANAGGGVAGNVSVLLGNGDGTFQAAVNYRAGTGPDAVVVADFNSDGKLDLAVANPPDGTVSILLGRGDGTFKPAVNYHAGAGAARLAVGDFNGDSKLDLVIGSSTGVCGGFSVLLGNGDGTFKSAVSYDVGACHRGVAVGDFNGDGKADLALVGGLGLVGKISVLLGNGDGTFQAAVDYAVGAGQHSIAVGDLNGDGKADLVAANYVSATISVLLGNGDGTFQTAVNYDVGQNPQSVAVGDFNGDGKADLAVANSGDGTISVLLGNGDGTFQPAVNFYAGTRPDYFAVGDFNGDGTPDLAVPVSDDNNIAVLLNTCPAAAPTLAIVRTNSTMTVSWPFPSTGFVLESTPSLRPPNWQPAVETPTTNNSQLVVTAPASQRERYFRLHKP